MNSTTQTTLNYLRAKGYVVAVTEKFNHFVGVRQDLFGWIDIIALDPERRRILGVQTTTTPYGREHLKKMLANQNFESWLSAGGTAWLMCWEPSKANQKRQSWGKKRPRTVKITEFEHSPEETSLFKSILLADSFYQSSARKGKTVSDKT